MRVQAPFLLRLPLLLGALLGTGSLPAAAEDALPLRIMLQGNSAAALRQLVEDAGGSVTHDLAIIEAVGAVVSPAQLEAIRSSPLVLRLIDDLSLDMSEPLPPPDEASCSVGGALEATLRADGIDWPLYNQGPPAKLTRLEMSWPNALGELTLLRLTTGDLHFEAEPAPAGARRSLALEFAPEQAPILTDVSHLQVGFAHSLDGEDGRLAWAQKDFHIKLEFGDECGSELIPGYADYAGDTYYPTVSGASELHLHGITGRGVTVAVLDSGLWEHPALALDTRGKPRIAGRYDAIRNIVGQPVLDASGHGTHMSSVISHSEEVLTNSKPSGTWKGIAPDVNLVAVKAFDEDGQGEFLDIVRGIQWIVEQREALDIRVLNLSFAARPRWPYFLDPINQALMKAWAAGITIVAAAGNEGPDPMTIGSPGNLPYLITVGAYTDSWTAEERDDDYIPDFSSRGPTPTGHIKPDIVAPGGHVAGLVQPGSTLTRKHPNYMISTGELVMTGTSQASALVAGIAALLLQLEPDMTPDDVKCKLMSSAEPAITPDGRLAYSPFQQGSGAVSAVRAVTLGQRNCGNSELNLARDIAGEQYFEGPAILDEQGKASLPGLQRMLASEQPGDGPSSDIKWGVKDHIEREDAAEPAPDLPFPWLEVYLSERAVIEALSAESAPVEAAQENQPHH
ncbi:MAG: S8 family peptidase [Haliea sp.]|uniref:S8 family peptidase n=1 Tax=Haliea sp. TaxID=1932666 RepID=UPI0032EC415D